MIGYQLCILALEFTFIIDPHQLNYMWKVAEALRQRVLSLYDRYLASDGKAVDYPNLVSMAGIPRLNFHPRLD